MPPKQRSSVRDAIRAFHSALHDPVMLDNTVRRLREEGEISSERAERLLEILSDLTATTNYILGNLAVHLGIGASKVVLPLPIGSLLRGTWVVLSRGVETIRRRPHYARVHSLRVLAVACIPFFGYLAYIVALRRHDPDAAFLYANHIALLRFGVPLEQALQSRPRLVQWIVRRAVGTELRAAEAGDRQPSPGD